MSPKFIDIIPIHDQRGGLVSLEVHKNIPFEVKRVYYLYALKPSESRGFHAHKRLKQVLISLSGSCRITLDDGSKSLSVILDSPEKGILIEGLVWREMHDFSTDCILLVLASEHYDEDDYIRDYSHFKVEVRENANT